MKHPFNDYKRWVDAVFTAHYRGWRCVEGWNFLAPGGTVHDLSAADLTQLDEIEGRGLFLT